MKKKIYLSGPIMDEHADAAKTWRERATAELRDQFVILDPMRRNFKDREVDSANEITEFDLQDVRDADILLVNYSKVSIGTSMEVSSRPTPTRSARPGWCATARRSCPTSTRRSPTSATTSSTWTSSSQPRAS